MAPPLPRVLFFFAFSMIVFVTTRHVQLFSQSPITCHNPYKFPNSANFSACDDLPFLNSSIHWNYDVPSNTIDMAFKNYNVEHNQWIAWAINPASTGMVGSQSFVAFKKSDGTRAAYTSPIATYGTRLEKGNLSFNVHAVSASFEGPTMIIYAKFQLPGNSTMVNHVWQQGFLFQDTLYPHPLKGDNLKSFDRLDFLDASYYHTPKIILLRKVGGILNDIGWGILLPIGVMMAGYLKEFEATKSVWFHLHWVCMIVAYVIGMAGCVVNIIRVGIKQFFMDFFSYGCIQFVFSTVQILGALFLIRPKKGPLWANKCHFILGYAATLIAMLGGGFSLPKGAYIGIIISLACVAAILDFRLYRSHKKMEVHPEMSPRGNNLIP